MQSLRSIFSPLLLALLAMPIILSGCSDETSPPIRLGTNVWPGYEPIYLAKNMAFIGDEQLRLVEHSSASQVIRAYRNGELDAAALTLDEALLLAESGFDFRVVHVADISDGGDVIVARPGVNDFASLKGKRVGVENNALGAYVLARALELNSMTAIDIEPVLVEVSEHERAYEEGRVDAVVTFEPVRSRILGKGGQEVFTSRQIPNEIVDVVIVDAAYLKLHPQQVDKLTDSWFSALEHIGKSPEDAAMRMAPRMSLRPKEVMGAFDGLKLPDRAEVQRLLYDPSPGLMSSVDKLIKVMRQNNLLSGAVDGRRLFGS